MIIRRMAEAIRKQDWFTVFIEFTLVVAGVLVALQFDNWNEGRRFDAMERDYLVQLREEILANDAQVQARMEFIANVTVAGKRALGFLKEDKPCTDNCTQLLVDFFQATQVWGVSDYTSVYNEMKRLGLPRSNTVKKATDSYYLVFQGMSTSMDSAPLYRPQVRNEIPVSAIDLLWRHCHINVYNTGIEIILRDCATELGAIDAAPILETFRSLPGLYSNLNGWVGQNAFALRNYAAQTTSVALAIAAIDAELERTQ